jgi:hypothetical protein
LIAARWDLYRMEYEAILDDVEAQKASGASESAVYWKALKSQDALASDTLEAMAYNPPPGEESLEKAIGRDRWALEKKLEDPARARGRSSCVKSMGENPSSRPFDIGPFYRAAGLLPGTNPARKGGFVLPPGCRTVTEREPGLKLILRAGDGTGTVVMGGEESPLAYDYLVVPPETPWLVENTGKKPLEVEYIALQP